MADNDEPKVKRRNIRRELTRAASDLPQELDLERAIDTGQTATLLGLAPITLAQQRPHGMGPPFFRVGRAIRYRLRDVLAYRDARMVGKVSP